MQEIRLGGPLGELAPFCRRAAAQGAVLLKNEGGLLPIKEEDNIALFGRCQIDYYRSGTGSGGAVNVEYSTNLLDGLRSFPWVHLNEQLVCTYESWVKENPFNTGAGLWAGEPWNQEEMPLTEELVRSACAVSNKAVIVIGRTAGEDQDNEDKPGSYRLTAEEEREITLVTKYFTQVAVVLNVSNIMDMSFMEAEWSHGHIGAVLYTWHGGIEGGNAAADILTGAVCPGGHLTDTIARSLKDYPSHANYGREDYNLYEEDIYVGYRYFETFCPEKVLFPFGFGLSYTTFSWEPVRAYTKGAGSETRICIQVQVKNTGNYAGREVIQIYVEAPQGSLGQPKKALVSFAKTELLAPGETQLLTMETKAASFASYDDGGITGNKSCYVLEAGEYRFHAGTDCRNTKEIKAEDGFLFSPDKTIVVQSLNEAAAPVRAFQRIRPQPAENGKYRIDYEPVPLRTIDLEKRILENLPPALLPAAKEEITFGDVKAGRATLAEFTAQLSERELATIVRGEGMCNLRVTSGTAAAFGGISDELAKKGIPAGCAADGPSGIRRDTGEKATQLPIGTLLACSFDAKLVEELFYLEGQELRQNEVDTLLGPGMNIHRYPLNGRNFEYFSEDPYVTGIMASACERGMDRAGVVGTLKHFACNNQEKARHTVDAVVSERALREIYLKGFEMAVKEGAARAVMTTYNPLNGCQNSCNYDLNTTILRGEWGYTGIVMTDWWARLDDVVRGGAPDYTNMASMVRAQNDIYMVFNNNGAVINSRKDNTEQALQEGGLTLGELQRCAMNILRFLLAAPASEREVKAPEPVTVKALPVAPAEAEEATEVEKLDTYETGTVLLRVEKSGRYGIHVKLMSTESNRAQMLCQLCLNGEKAADIQTNGTNGVWFLQRVAAVRLEQGFYEMSVKHIRPGIQLSAIRFVEEEEN